MARPKSSTRPKVEECHSIDARQIAGRELAFHRPRPTATVTCQWPDGTITRVVVALTVTRPKNGGPRLWFVCPSCGGRRRKLYATDDDRGLSCRVCRRLVYGTQYANRNDWFALWERLLRQYLRA